MDSAKMGGAKYIAANLMGASLKQVIGSNVAFDNACMIRAELKDSHLISSSFKDGVKW